MSEYLWSDFTPRDIERLYGLEQLAHGFPWSRTVFASNFTPFHFNQMISRAGQPVGYYVGQLVAGEASLLNIVVAPSLQGRGLGRQLLEHFLAQCHAQGAEDVWLEVRESNHTARTLYQQVGFNEVTVRENYYPAAGGREAAVIMNYLL